MAKITAKEVRTAAASVAGARGMGIETAASKAAPDLLARAEAALRAMSGRADNEAISQSGGRVAAQADALESAIRELRDALGVAAEEFPPLNSCPCRCGGNGGSIGKLAAHQHRPRLR